MAKFYSTLQKEEPEQELQLRLKYHPLRIFTLLLLVGISSAFLFISASYFFTTIGTDFNSFDLPLIFHANTILILVSSYTINQTRKAIRADDWQGYSTGLLVTFGLGIAFTVFQVIGWQELMKSGFTLKNNVAAAYLYVLSGLHVIHLVAGVLLVGWFLLHATEIRKDAVKALLFESNPFSRMKVDLLCIYWHFVDGVWLYLYLFFVFSIYVLNRIPL